MNSTALRIGTLLWFGLIPAVAWGDAAEDLKNGRTALQQGRVQQALPLLEAAARDLPESVEAQLALAECYLKVGRLDEAVARYRRVLKLSVCTVIYSWASVWRLGSRMRSSSAGGSMFSSREISLTVLPSSLALFAILAARSYPMCGTSAVARDRDCSRREAMWPRLGSISESSFSLKIVVPVVRSRICSSKFRAIRGCIAFS